MTDSFISGSLRDWNILITNKITGPYPAIISATISDTYHVAYDPPEEMIWFSEYENYHFHIKSLKYDKFGFEEGKKFTISVEPGDIELCGGKSPCFKILKLEI